MVACPGDSMSGSSVPLNALSAVILSDSRFLRVPNVAKRSTQVAGELRGRLCSQHMSTFRHAYKRLYCKAFPKDHALN